MSSCGSPAPVPPSPLQAFIRAHLPNQQRTSVTVRYGVTVREALSKAMSLRKLTPETCVVYQCSKPQVRMEVGREEGLEWCGRVCDIFTVRVLIAVQARAFVTSRVVYDSNFW